MTDELKSVALAAWLACGLLSGDAAEVIPYNSQWKFLKGFAEASSPDPAAWRAINFNDASWTTAPSPFWYGDVQPSPGTQLTDMRGAYTCIFMRRTFVLANVNEISDLRLDALSDDGFIAWINGTEVARFNMPTGAVPYNGTALPALTEPIPPESYTLANPRNYLVPGTNVLAVQAFNASLSDSSDLVINVALSYTVDTVPPTVANLIPPMNALVRSLNSIEVHFSEPVSGVDAADLLINGVPATSVDVFTPSQYVFEFPQPSPGTVQVSWGASHNIRDLSSAANPFAGGNWSVTLDPSAPLPGVVINEFMAENHSTLNDEDGDSSDWIELYNADTSAVNLNGWFLTDEASQLAKWRFPNVTLPANGYLVIFASDKNRTNPAARLHTHFKLDSGGEFLALVDSRTNIASSFAPQYPPQTADVSYGRERANPSLAGHFTVPTPGGPNSSGGPGFAPDVHFSRPGGTFASAFTLALTASGSSAEIRYTLDGTLPTSASTLYAGPIPISASTRVRSRAFQPGLLPGPIRSETYLALAANVINYTSDLPVVVIHNFSGGSVPANGDQFAYMAVFEPVNGRTSLTNTPTLSTRAGINIRGSSTQGYPKSSFAVEWWDEFNDDKNEPVLGMPADADWILYAPNNFEPVLIHNPFIYGLSNDIGRYAPRTRFVVVYLNTGGGAISSANYNGIYVLEEKIKRGKDRVNIDGLEPEHVNPPEVTGGYMMKIDRLDPGDSGFGGAGQSIAYVDPKEPEIELPQRDPQEQYIRNYMSAFGTALNGVNFRNPVTGYAAYVNVDSWIDHHILNVMAFNVDALRLSTYFYKERNGKLSFGPIWDFDRALGSTDGRDSNARVWRGQGGDQGTDFFNYPWWGRMFNDIDFWQRWIDRWQEQRDGPFALASLNARIDALANIVRQEQPREQTKWGVAPRGGSYQAEVNRMKTWLADRINFMDTNFLARPAFSSTGRTITPGFQLVMLGPPGATIYYTLDGSDPRLSGGNVSPTAQVYPGPVLLTTTRIVKARAFNASHFNLTGANNPPLTTPWSGLTQARFSVNPYAAAGSLAVREIQFHPAPPSTTELAVNPAFTNEDFEFLELENVTNVAVDLYDARFTRGIDFSFNTSSIATLQPGASLLLVKNLQAFFTRYGSRPNVVGVFSGFLDNAGEVLRLEDGFGQPIFEFEYNNAWYPTADGHGFSLVLVNADPATWSEKSAWRPSATSGGSPGVADPAPSFVPPVVVNEALAHTEPPEVDSVELFNPSASAADVSGWFLTDDPARPKKFRIPNGTSIAPGGYRVFTEDEFMAAPDPAARFRISSLGDQIYLYSSDAAGNLRWYAHGFDFGAAENGISFGRLLRSDGREQFVAQSAVTLGSANAGPRIGPVIINEIMYHPPDIGTGTNAGDNVAEEFIELHNITDNPMPLFDPGHPTNTWRLRDAMDFTFPMGTTMPARSFLLLVSFDPALDSTLLVAFRSRYNVPVNVPILGPYSGKLDNSSDSVELLKPDPPQPPTEPNAGFVPFVLVDRVKYEDRAPWPSSADGTNYYSLHRHDTSAFGNDPANWIAAPATAGQANTGAANPDLDGDGLPNEWELAHGLNANDATGDNGANGDPDRDGVTNMQEFLSGTDPRNPSSLLKINSVVSDGVRRIRFTAAAAKSYTLQYQFTVNGGVWQKLADVPAQTVAHEVEVTDPATGDAVRFYRLVTPLVP